MSPGRSDSIQKQQIVGDLKLLELVTISRLSRYATTKNANQACWGRAWIRRRLPAVYKKYGLASDPRITRGMLAACARATCTDSTDHRTDSTHDAGIIGTPFHEPFHGGAADY
jgi:hypothetical protein